MSTVSKSQERAAAQEQLGKSFKGAMGAVRRMRGRETHQADELSDAQYHALFCLRHHESLSTSEIALASEVTPASATEMLDALARAGLVQRARSERDRRVVLSSLTDRGLELVEAKHARFQHRLDAALAPFGAEELRTAATVIDALREMFDQLADERS